MAETTKVDLSTSTKEIPQLYVGDDYIDMPITRGEFEEASKELLMRTIEETRKILQDHPNQKPEIILLTGGASQMPMVQREMENTFPQYKGKIIYFRPSRAIAYGAARYGTVEGNPDVKLPGTKGNIVQQRIMYDIGVRYVDRDDKSKHFICTFLKSGTPIPCISNTEDSSQSEEGRYTHFAVFEARVPNPDYEEINRDYTEIMSVSIDHGRDVPKGHPHEARMRVDENRFLTIEARDASSPDLPFIKASVELKNLS